MDDEPGDDDQEPKARKLSEFVNDALRRQGVDTSVTDKIKPRNMPLSRAFLASTAPLDYPQVEVPPDPTLDVIAEQRVTNSRLAELADLARQDAAAARAEAKASHTHTVRALWAAWIAVVVSVVGVVIGLVVR